MSSDLSPLQHSWVHFFTSPKLSFNIHEWSPFWTETFKCRFPCVSTNPSTSKYAWMGFPPCQCLQDLFAPKTMSKLPFTTIPLHPLVWPFCTKDYVPTTIYHYLTMSTASIASIGLTFLHQRQCLHYHIANIPLHPSGLTFLHQRQCPHQHIPLFHCIHLVWLFCTKNNVPTTIYHYSTVSTGLTLLYQRLCPNHHIPLFDYVHCIHCIHWFDIFAPKTMSPLPYANIPLHPSGLTFLHQRQCPHQHIPLFHCIHCILSPLKSLLCNSYTTWYF